MVFGQVFVFSFPEVRYVLGGSYDHDGEDETVFFTFLRSFLANEVFVLGNILFVLRDLPRFNDEEGGTDLYTDEG